MLAQKFTRFESTRNQTETIFGINVAKTRKLLEIIVDSNEKPKWDTFKKVLQKRLQFLESMNTDSISQNKDKISTLKTKAFSLKDSSNLCRLCKKYQHPLYKYPYYKKLKEKKSNLIF